MTQVVLKNISLTRGTTAILRDVDLTIDAGEFCVFVGPSGCGKSSLLRLIAGLEDGTCGDIEINGRSMAGVPGAQRDIAMVFQGYALYPHMTVFDNMAFGLRQAKYSSAEVTSRVQQASRILQLDTLLDRKPKSLSGGQRQRVAIGRAIVKKPKVFLFDEPLSNLDAALRIETRAEIAKLHRDMDSASMLYVTHDQVEALTLADKIVLLRPVAGTSGVSSVAQVGRPLELYHHPANLFTARFIGAPMMNLLDACVTGISDHGVAFKLQGQHCTADVAAHDLALGDAVVVGIRPEHVIVGRGPLRAQIKHIEALGEHSVLYLEQGRNEEQASVLLAKSTDEQLEVGSTVELEFPSQAMHVFGSDGMARRRLRA